MIHIAQPVLFAAGKKQEPSPRFSSVDCIQLQTTVSDETLNELLFSRIFRLKTGQALGRLTGKAYHDDVFSYQGKLYAVSQEDEIGAEYKRLKEQYLQQVDATVGCLLPEVGWREEETQKLLKPHYSRFLAQIDQMVQASLDISSEKLTFIPPDSK